MTNWCKIGIYLVLNQKKSKKYLVQNQNNFVPASKDLVSFWCRNKINLVQNQIQLPKSFGAEKNCFGAGKKPSWCEKKIILVQKREKPAGPVWCRKKIFWCRNRSLPFFSTPYMGYSCRLLVITTKYFISNRSFIFNRSFLVN